jgi:hypothetical protein
VISCLPPKRGKAKNINNLSFVNSFRFSVSVSRDAPTTQHDRYVPCFIPGNPKSNGLVRFKRSPLWMGAGRGPVSARLDHITWAKRGTTWQNETSKTSFVLPLINKVGMITPYLLGIWKCSYHEIFATLLSTVYKRLQARVWSRYKKKAQVSEHQLLKLAFIHVCHPNDIRFFNTAYSLISRPKMLLKYLYKNFKKMDESIRFLFDQLCKSSSWFQHKASRPCTKSIKLSDIPEYRRPMIFHRLPTVWDAMNMVLRRLTSEYSTVGVEHKKALVMSLRGSETSRIFAGNHQ